MTKKNIAIIIYLLVYILLGVFSVFIYRDSKSLFVGGLGSYLYPLSLIFIIAVCVHSRRSLSKKLIWTNNIILIIWFLVLTYLWQYGWYVLNRPV